MTDTNGGYATRLRELASLMVAVAGESVTMVKKSAPEAALKLKKRAEWELYLEFLKVLFNLADRLSAFYVPVQEQPALMDRLEDAVTNQLKNVLAPALGPDSDEMEFLLTVGKAVTESRQTYDRFQFVPTEESKAKDEFFKTFAERIARLMGAAGDGMVLSAATLCASAAIPAMKGLFEEIQGQGQAPGGPAQAAGASTVQPRPSTTGNEIKLVSVMATVHGEEVETRWGLHPRFKEDLKPGQLQELARLMNRVTRILGERYAAVAFSADWATWQKIGHA
ncbi:hypothetical protein [Nitrospira sp. Kam-Ns4a]